MICIFDLCQTNNGLFCERRYTVQHYQPVIHLKKEKKEMKKVFGTEDSFLYADNNTSWANDLALELWYNFNYIQLHIILSVFLL